MYSQIFTIKIMIKKISHMPKINPSWFIKRMSIELTHGCPHCPGFVAGQLDGERSWVASGSNHKTQWAAAHPNHWMENIGTCTHWAVHLYTATWLYRPPLCPDHLYIVGKGEELYYIVYYIVSSRRVGLYLSSKATFTWRLSSPMTRRQEKALYQGCPVQVQVGCSIMCTYSLT